MSKARSAQRPSEWLRGLPGSFAGLFLARIALEATGRPWPWAVAVLCGFLAALLGLLMGRWLSARGVRLWPACVLLVYVLWPQRDPGVAASAAVLAALVRMLSEERPALPRWVAPVVDGATFVVALTAYAATTAPDVLPADAGEFQLVATLLGVAHPPGYPLYTMLGHLFIRLVPWGSPAYRLNLMSAPLAAVTLVLVGRATRLWARQLGASPLARIGAGLIAALTLGTATTFWAQATIANIRIPTAFFAALALYALAQFAVDDPDRRDRHLLLLALALGLGLTHHQSLAFSGLFYLLYVVLIDPRLPLQPRRWWRPALAGLVGLLPLAYLPLRGAMGAIQAPRSLATLQGFLNHFLARGFAGDMFAFANASDLPHRAALLPTLLPFQFNTLLLVAALVGLLGLARRNWRLCVLLAGSLALHTFVSITYRAPQTVEYLLPAYLPIAIAGGLVPSLPLTLRPEAPFTRQRALLSSLLAALVLWGAVLNGWAHAPSLIELAQDTSTRQWVQPLLERAPADALLLSDYRWATPLAYLQQVEGRRPDVEVRYVYPIAGEEYRDTWQRRVLEADPARPLLSTHYYQFSGTTAEPWETGFRLSPRPLTEPSAPLTPIGVTFGGQVQAVGYSLQQNEFRPGQVAEVTLAWRASAPLDPRPSFTLRLVGEDGTHVAQADRALGTDAAPGEVRFERLVLPIYPTLPPGRYQLLLGAYAVTEAGFESLAADTGETSSALGWLEVAAAARPPFTLHRREIPFAGGPTLSGVDYDRSVPDALRIVLHWRGPAEGGESVRVWTGDGAEATASLPPIAAGAHQTVAVHLPEPADGPLQLALADTSARGRAAAGPWGWTVQEIRLPTPAPDARFVALGDAMAVIGASARPASAGDTMVVDVTLVALRPLTADASTSVRLMGDDGRWLAAHDIQPALGAVPTLKWIRGSRVIDRHLLPIPEDFTGASVYATIVAYERFRLTPLLPMDGRFDAVPLGTWPQP
jgi:hypothetical protein